jgi:hypothetical protein
MELTTLETASRNAKAWVPEGYDGRTHYAALLTALVPAFVIVGSASYLLHAII